MKKAIAIMFSLLIVFLLGACFPHDNFVPDSLADPMGMYFYNGNTKTLLDDSKTVPIVKQAEIDGVVYDLSIVEVASNRNHNFFGDDFYFCAVFNDTTLGLFRHNLINKSTSAIYTRDISQEAKDTKIEVWLITNYFIVLRRSELDSDGTRWLREYIELDHCGNIIDTGFDFSTTHSHAVSFSPNYMMTRRGNVFAIEHLYTREEIILGALPNRSISAYFLRYQENEEFFSFTTPSRTAGDVYSRGLVVYDKVDGTIHHKLWDRLGIRADILNLSNGLFYTNNAIYQYRRGEGIVLVHFSSYWLSSPSFHNGVAFFSATEGDGNWFMYFYNFSTNEYGRTTLEQSGLYCFNQFYFDDFIFYVTSRRGRGWWGASTHHYLHRVNTKTGQDEMVGYREAWDENPFVFHRFGY
ncbi:MAG: hypothetical protein FWD86_00085 [Firmicutes bacterium]|nr:hypothetical protein [Bacillota bacterium]